MTNCVATAGYDIILARPESYVSRNKYEIFRERNQSNLVPYDISSNQRNIHIAMEYYQIFLYMFLCKYMCMQFNT